MSYFIRITFRSLTSDFPSADSITRRLKKVMQIIIKNWNNIELMSLNQSEKFFIQNKKIKEFKTEKKRNF